MRSNFPFSDEQQLLFNALQAGKGAKKKTLVPFLEHKKTCSSYVVLWCACYDLIDATLNLREQEEGLEKKTESAIDVGTGLLHF